MEVKASHVDVSFDVTQAFLEIHIFALGFKAALDVKFIF